MLYKKNESPVQAINEQKFVFNPTNEQIRVEIIDNQAYFVAKDVCKALSISNDRDALTSLEDDEKRVSVIPTPSGNQKMNLVNESGLYTLIFQSRKPQAKAFRKWVTSEVLPSIRRTGGYHVKQKCATVEGKRGYIRRGELVNAEMLNLLWLIDEFLLHGDRKKVALEIGVSEVSVSHVLNGVHRSNRILTALYNRARENRRNGLLDLYNDPGRMQARLLGLPDGGTMVEQRLLRSGECPQWRHKEPPKEFIPHRRGAQPGNQNARKKGGAL